MRKDRNPGYAITRFFVPEHDENPFCLVAIFSHGLVVVVLEQFGELGWGFSKAFGDWEVSMYKRSRDAHP